MSIVSVSLQHVAAFASLAFSLPLPFLVAGSEGLHQLSRPSLWERSSSNRLQCAPSYKFRIRGRDRLSEFRLRHPINAERLLPISLFELSASNGNNLLIAPSALGRSVVETSFAPDRPRALG